MRDLTVSDLSAEIKRVMHCKNLTVQDVADKCNLSRQAIYDLLQSKVSKTNTYKFVLLNLTKNNKYL